MVLHYNDWANFTPEEFERLQKAFFTLLEQFECSVCSNWIYVSPSKGNIEEGGGYLAEVADLPGCVADGETVDEAVHEIESAILSWIKTAKEFGDAIPALSLASKYSGQWRIRVPKHLHAALALRAKEEGVSLNMLAAILLAEGVGKQLKTERSSQ